MRHYLASLIIGLSTIGFSQTRTLVMPAQGGTGKDTSHTTGCAQVNAGIWSFPTCSSGGGGNPALPFTSVQFNDSGAFGGSANFVTNALGQVEVLNGGTQASFQVHSADTGGFNYFSTDGNSVTYRGTGAASGGQFAPGFNIEIDDGDMISGGSAPNVIIGNFITTGVYRAGKSAIGIEVLPTSGVAAAGNITNFEADEPTFGGGGASVTNHDGFIAGGAPEATRITGYNYYFHSSTSSGIAPPANFCDFVGDDQAAGPIRVKLGCGATSVNTLLGPTTIRATTTISAASGPSLLQVVKGTFASLPTCATGIEGTMSPVTDSSTAVWGATITGSSTNHVLAYCNGTNWTVMAK